jgi:subtilisin-like proprotein convertase family protein
MSILDIPERSTISDIRLALDLTHTYIGDLGIDLIAPDNSSVTVHNFSGGSTDNIRKIYSISEVPALRGFLGKEVTGTWSLRVVDSWSMDLGRLNSWRLFAKVNNS